MIGELTELKGVKGGGKLIDDIDVIVPHQANGRILKAAALTYVAAAGMSLLDVMRWIRVLRP
jgi:Zn-dependent membrane protease YugP